MFSLVGSLLTSLRPERLRGRENCVICHLAIASPDERVPLPGGGHVHRGCATYRMRHHERAVRWLGPG